MDRCSFCRRIRPRVVHGALGATFMQTIATGAALHPAADAALKAAQAEAKQGSTLVSQGQTSIKLQQQTVDGVNTLISRVERMVDALTRPHPAPPSPLYCANFQIPAFIINSSLHPGLSTWRHR
jgi:hypothetical protein